MVVITYVSLETNMNGVYLFGGMSMHKERKFEGSAEVTYILWGTITGHGRAKTSYPTALHTRYKLQAI